MTLTLPWLVFRARLTALTKFRPWLTFSQSRLENKGTSLGPLAVTPPKADPAEDRGMRIKIV